MRRPRSDIGDALFQARQHRDAVNEYERAREWVDPDSDLSLKHQAKYAQALFFARDFDRSRSELTELRQRLSSRAPSGSALHETLDPLVSNLMALQDAAAGHYRRARERIEAIARLRLESGQAVGAAMYFYNAALWSALAAERAEEGWRSLYSDAIAFCGRSAELIAGTPGGSDGDELQVEVSLGLCFIRLIGMKRLGACAEAKSLAVRVREDLELSQAQDEDLAFHLRFERACLLIRLSEWLDDPEMGEIGLRQLQSFRDAHGRLYQELMSSDIAARFSWEAPVTPVALEDPAVTGRLREHGTQLRSVLARVGVAAAAAAMLLVGASGRDSEWCVSGTVRYGDGRPAVGAQVVLVTADGRLTTQSDSDGRYQISSPEPAGTSLIYARVSDYCSSSVMTLGETPGQVPDAVELVVPETAVAITYQAETPD